MIPPLKTVLSLIPSALLLVVPAYAETVEKKALMIIKQNAITTVGMGLPFPSSAGDETTRTYSGEFSASIKFDSKTFAVEGFKFNGVDTAGGGGIYVTPHALQFQDFVTYPPPTNTQSTIVTKVPYPNAASGTIRLSPETRENGDGEVEFGEVDSEGKLRNFDHKFYADQGNYITTYAIRGVAQDTIIDNYFPGVNLLYRGTSIVDIREVSSTIHERSVRAYLTIELDELQVTALQGNVSALNLDLVETEEGTIIANTGQFKIPTAYAEWATENGLNKPDPEDLNDSGLAYGILFALELPADATSLPISTENTGSGPVVKIILPASGLNNPMSVDYTTDLTAPNWPALEDAYYLDGADTLDLGMTGEPTFGFPDGEIGFIRFVTVIE